MRRAITAHIDGATGEVDILGWLGRAALELIGQGGLGYSFDPLEADMDDGYGHALKQLQSVVISQSPNMQLRTVALALLYRRSGSR